MQTSILTQNFPYTQARNWVRVFQTRDKTARQQLIRSIYASGNYVASVDFPGSLFVDDLVEIYPSAKFVLTVRESPGAWRVSFNETIDTMSQKWWRVCTFLMPSQHAFVQPMAREWEEQCLRRYGEGVYGNRGTKAYEGHNEWVKRVVPEERLLVSREGVGWEKLCAFLGREVPDGVEYPRVNEKAKVKAWFKEGATVGCVLWLAWACGLGTLGWWLL